MKICALMTPLISHTDYATDIKRRTITVGGESKTIEASQCYEGSYDYFLSQQFIPVAIHEPVFVDERVEDRYGELSTGKQGWAVPTAGAIQANSNGKTRWLFPIFRDMQELEKSPMGKWLAARFKGKWSMITNPKSTKKSELIRHRWSKQFANSGCDAFIVCIAMRVRGDTTTTNPQANNPYEPIPTPYKVKGMDLVGEGGERRYVPSARQEAGTFFKTEYPMFVVPTAKTVSPSYMSAGGRYFNIAPLKQDGKKSVFLEDYASECGYKLERPVLVGKKPKMKTLTQSQQTLAPKEWFKEQYMKYQKSIIYMPLDTPRYNGGTGYVGWANGNIMKLLIQCAPAEGSHGGFAQTVNVTNAETMSDLLRHYLHPQKVQQITDGMFNTPDLIKNSHYYWPLDKVQLEEKLIRHKESMPGLPNVQYNDKYSYGTTSLPPHLLLITFSVDDRKVGTYSHSLRETPMLYSSLTHSQQREHYTGFYDFDLWPESKELQKGMLNHGFLNFITPTVWDN